MEQPGTFELTLPWLRSVFPDLSDFQMLAQGGQKLVLTATHPIDGQVVLKLFRPNQSLDEVEREVLAVQQVESEHVPRILSQGDLQTPLGASYWFREQRISGETLRTRLMRGSLPPLEVLRLGRHILDALVRAEQVAIVHRDVKPDNIMIDSSGKFWLLDFGLARHLSLTSLTQTALHFGKMTPGYAPPEQMQNDKPAIDSRADLFALGVTLYESATGANPFRNGARDDLEIIRRVTHDQLPALTLQIEAANLFADLIAALTQKRRHQRPKTAQAAALWLTEVCEANGL